MKIDLKAVVAYFARKKTADFSGSIKLSFENGDIVTVNEANRHDLPTSQNTNGEKLISDYISVAMQSGFFGTLVFVFDSGEVVEFAYSRTFKGERLKGLFERGQK